MSSFLQCSIELLNSYYFVKQRKCKRGLSELKDLTHACTGWFPPNSVSHLCPLPSTPVPVATTPWCRSRVELQEVLPADPGPFQSLTGRRQQHKPKATLQPGVPAPTESGPCFFSPAERAKWPLDFSRRNSRGLSNLSPGKTSSCMKRPATSIIFISRFSASPCQHAPSSQRDTLSFTMIF